MKSSFSLISKIHESANQIIVAQLNINGVKGFVPSHGDILAVLYANNKTTMKDIADKIHRTRPTVTVLVDKLEKLGYVKRVISDKDSRYTFIELTQKGQDFKPIFEKISNNLNEKLYKNISEKEYQMLENLLDKVLKNIKE